METESRQLASPQTPSRPNGPESSYRAGGADLASARVKAVVQAARYQGVELDPNEFRRSPGEDVVSAAALSTWAQGAGLWARAVRIGWRHLFKFRDSDPIVLLFEDGSAGLLTGVNIQLDVVYLKDPELGGQRRAGRD